MAMNSGALACFVPDGSCREFGGSAEMFMGLYAYAPWGSLVAGAAVATIAFILLRGFQGLVEYEPKRDVHQDERW